MLNSPSADAGGYSNLFSVTDVNNLVRKDRSLLDKAIEVNGLLAEAHKFLDAYSRLALSKHSPTLRNAIPPKSMMWVALAECLMWLLDFIVLLALTTKSPVFVCDFI